MPFIEPSKGEVPVIPDGTYEVFCLDVEEKYVEEDAYGKHDKLVFSLRLNDILDDDGNEIIFKPQINRAWGSDKANLYKYAVGFGLHVDLNVGINTDLFKGKKAQAFIFTEAEGKYPKITALIPVKANGKSAPSAAQEARQPPEGAAVDADTVRPSIANFAGDVDWTKFWAAADGICGNHDKARAAVAAQFGGDLKPLESMELSLVMDLLEVLRG